MPAFRLSISRTWLPFAHAGIALALVLHLYLPRWEKIRARDLAEQAYVEEEASMGRWPPVNAVGFEACYFGAPKQITAMFPANLPSLIIAGFLVVPSNARDHLLEPAPGRILPTTRAMIFAAMFAVVVGLQWYLIALFLKPERTPVAWQGFLYTAPIACIPVGLVLRDKWIDLFRLGALPFWGFIVFGSFVLPYWKRRCGAGKPAVLGARRDELQ